MMLLCKAFEWHRGKVRWRLSSGNVLALSSYVLAILGVAAGIVAHKWPQPDDEWWVAATKGAHILNVAMVVTASLGYIYVSWKAVRSLQLHLHGLYLLVNLTAMPWYMVSEALLLNEMCAAAAGALAVSFVLWALDKALLFWLMKEKMSVLGSLIVCRVQASQWVCALIASAALVGAAGAVVLIFKGLTCEEVFHGSTAELAASISVVDRAILLLILFISGMGAFGLIIAGSGTMYAANELRRGAIAKLVERQVGAEELAKVQRTLGQHVLGICLSITSTQAVTAAALLDGLDLLGNGRDSQEAFVLTAVALVDVIGDAAGILLLSGIGVLLVHEDPGAGDVGGHIRGLLHSAVLTSQAEMAFEGTVESAARGGLCVASFPGRFLGDWHALTWACERGELSSACVFLPKADPQQRFGQHAPNAETPGRCWCHRLYGETKPWGCLWWETWQKNIERAAELELDLVVVFFPGQVGKGMVSWGDLGTADLWDGIGLGGSQKAEVAYMRMRGFRVIDEDMETFRQRLKSAEFLL